MPQTHTVVSSTSWRWIAVAWCVGGMFQASQAVLIMRFAENRRHDWLPLFATELATWLPSKAQLAALRRQMEPHFMFNTLNSITGLVRDQRNEAAVSMIVGLSEFLRRASEDSHRSQVTLGEEVEYLQRYLEIQKARFGERLRVSVDIPADLLDAQVPSLLLQPLVENAIKHGLAHRVTGGTIRVAGERRNGSLHLSVYNDGPSLADGWQRRGAGVGLANLRTRLQILHGETSELQMRPAGADGVEVALTLPLQAP